MSLSNSIYLPSKDGPVADLHRIGVGLIPAAFTATEVDEARHTVLAHLSLMRNTRPTPSSRHLAGFHQFPALEPLHQLVTGNRLTQEVMTRLLGPSHRTIGLSDITVNRSQQWHKDVLRGRYRHFMEDERPCESHHGKLFKVIFYLQDSSSLHFVPGSHRLDIPLENDLLAIPADDAQVIQVQARLGDAVIIDICTTHRGSPEMAFESPHVTNHPRILISTVFGRSNCKFAECVERGNTERLSFWRRGSP
jgi:hypothetical protein